MNKLNENDEEIVGNMNLFINPNEDTIKRELLAGANDLFMEDKKHYDEEVDIVSREEWVERIKELLSINFEGDDIKSLSSLFEDNSELVGKLSFKDIKYLYRYEVGITAEEEEVIYFLTSNPFEKFPRCIPKKLVGEAKKNKMFQ